ncbi:MAG TPA: ABC transporter permease [Vicinamibacterales bacterium]|jgi:predicted permease
MTRLRILLSRLWSLVRSRQMDREIDDEIASHLAEATEEYIEQGLSPEEARRAALRNFGGVTQTKEVYRHVRSFMSLDDLARELRHTVRTLRRSPGFTMVTVVTLALGIGATTAIFSVVNGVFLRPLPYPNADRLMQPLTIFAGGSQGSFSYPDFEDLRDQNRSFAGLAALTIRNASAAMGGQGFRVGWTRVSPGFLSIMGVPPALGRGFTADEEQAGAPVALASYGYWQNRLAGRSDFASQSVRVNERTYAIIGVMPPGYDFPAGTDLWSPQQPAAGENRTARGYGVVGRLRDDVSVAAAKQDLSAIAKRLKQLHGNGANMVDATVRPVMEQVAGSVRAALTVLLVASGVLLLVACVNVANLMLARALARDRESALCLALGAGPWRVAGRFMVESLVLTIAGAGLGLPLAIGGVAALLAQNTTQLPRTGEIGVDMRVLVFSLAVSLLAASVVSVFPALRAARRDPRDALADSPRIQGGSAATRRLSSGLVMAQIALTVVLLVGAGLVGRSVLNLLDEDPGYRTDGALVMDVWLPTESYGGARTELSAGDISIANFLERLMSELQRIPGVERVGGVNHLPLTDPLTPSPGSNGNYLLLNRPDEAVRPEDRARLFAEPSRRGNAQFRVASADYFGAMGIPLIRGRVFDARDTRNAPHVAVVSASLAEERWPGEDPLGRLIDFTGMDGDVRTFTIVGIVADIEELGIGARPQPIFYADQRQRPRRANEFHVVIQGGGDVAALTAAARNVARNLDPQVPVGFRTLREVVSAWMAQRQFVLVLLAVFGVLALVLAATGVYGIVGYRAVRRTREIGVRVALGARAPDVVRLLVREGAMFAVGGVAIGLIVANGSTRLVASWLYGVGATDPMTFAAVAFAMIAVALAATWVPARRASRTDAMEALRHD